MNDLITFIRNNSVRGDCQCGECVDRAEIPQQPTGHTADLVFFKVKAVNKPDATVLHKLVQENQAGAFATVDLFDGQEHNYQEVGAWIGDQGLALTLMGLGSLLGLWKLFTPKNIFGDDAPDLAMRMAQAGYITIQAG